VLQLGKRDVNRCSTNKNWGCILNKLWNLDSRWCKYDEATHCTCQSTTEVAANRDARYGEGENNVDGECHSEAGLEWVGALLARAYDTGSHYSENCT